MIRTKAAIPIQEPTLVLFDMDGILFDTMPTHTLSWKTVSDEYGIVATREEFYLYEGMRGVDTINHLYHRTFGSYPSEELTIEIYRRKTELFHTLNDHTISLIPGTLDLITYLINERGCKVGVVTGSTVQNAYPRIMEHFEGLITPKQVITAEDVTKGKPDPEPYLRGISLFGKKPEETVIIENAPLGVRSGMQSGAFTIAVSTGPIKQMHLREEGANLVFPDMKSLLIWWKKSCPI